MKLFSGTRTVRRREGRNLSEMSEGLEAKGIMTRTTANNSYSSTAKRANTV